MLWFNHDLFVLIDLKVFHAENQTVNVYSLVKVTFERVGMLIESLKKLAQHSDEKHLIQSI